MKHYLEAKEYPEVARLVSEHFGGEREKIDLWFTTPNPMLGGLAPVAMLLIGRGEKLLAWVKSQLSENKK